MLPPVGVSPKSARGVAVLLLLSWFVPWQDSVKRGAVLEHATVEPVTTRTPGFLREVYVHDGEAVRAGQPLARLENLLLQGARPMNSKARPRPMKCSGARR